MQLKIQAASAFQAVHVCTFNAKILVIKYIEDLTLVVIFKFHTKWPRV